MPYQKTAKDKAWDKERQKLKSEINDWIVKCGQKEHTIQCQTGEIDFIPFSGMDEGDPIRSSQCARFELLERIEVEKYK